MTTRKFGYWFGGNKLPHGDGRKIRKGATLTVKPPLLLCHHGLHYSKHVLEAVKYAKDLTQLWMIEDVGETVVDDDKCCTTARKHLAKIEAKPILREFSRWCALRAVRLWDAPNVVKAYLRTGDESLRRQARKAAGHSYTEDASASGSAMWAANALVTMASVCYASGAAARAIAHAAEIAAVSLGASDGELYQAWLSAGASERLAQRKKLDRMISRAFRKERMK